MVGNRFVGNLTLSNVSWYYKYSDSSNLLQYNINLLCDDFQ
jgi:hypothetical protein